MADALFEVPRLARIYDTIDGPRYDLDHYEAIVSELRAQAVLDVGCGTGTFACRLAASGRSVTALDPAAASLDVARSKDNAAGVTWIHGDASALPDGAVDLATMTGNVAQVFVGDDEWQRALGAIRNALRPNGHLVFEAREPARRDWEHWTRRASLAAYDTPTDGRVEHWVELTDVALPLVSFRHHYVFEADGERLCSDSTLRFRPSDEIAHDLIAHGYTIVDIREAPDRPAKENVFIARSVP